MRHATPREILRRYQQAMIDMNADDLAELYAEDAVHELPFLFPGMPKRYEGREQVRAGYGRAWGAGSAITRAVREIAVHDTSDPEVIVVEQVVAGVATATDVAFEFTGVLMLRVRDGQIVHVRDYLDGLLVAHTMGRLPAVVAALEGSGG